MKYKLACLISSWVITTGEAFVMPPNDRQMWRSSIGSNTQRSLLLLLLPPSQNFDNQDQDIYPDNLSQQDLLDDDDISQHAVMADQTSQQSSTAGYRSIESWHHANRNPIHVLDRLKREQAHWRSKFEDLGGDGI